MGAPLVVSSHRTCRTNRQKETCWQEEDFNVVRSGREAISGLRSGARMKYGPVKDKPYRIRRKRVIGDKRDFPTKRLAQRELERILAEVNNPTYRPAVAINFAEFAEQWQANVLSQMNRPTRFGAVSPEAPTVLLRCLRSARHSPQTVQTFVSTCKASARRFAMP